jgi:sporulation protein YlmC with PRC-barrel domain
VKHEHEKKTGRGLAVLDAKGDKIGHMTDVYVDTAAEDITFAAVSVRRNLRRRVVLIPLADATVDPDSVRVRCGRKLAEQAPTLPADGAMSTAQEAAVFAHYDLKYRNVADRSRLRRRA